MGESGGFGNGMPVIGSPNEVATRISQIRIVSIVTRVAGSEYVPKDADGGREDADAAFVLQVALGDSRQVGFDNLFFLSRSFL